MSILAAPQRHVGILCLLLVAATLVFYNPIGHNHFIDFDDSPYIVSNPHVQAGLTWSTVKWSLTTFQEGNWHPVTWWSHALDCEMFHLNPAGHHYINLLLHAANAVLLFLLLRRATGLTWQSLVVGALFALHPVNVESVAWAAERKNVLSMLFFLLAIHAYDRYARSDRRGLFGMVAGLFALGLMAKPQIVTLPFVLLLWDYWPLERIAMGGAKRTEVEARIPGTIVPARSFWWLVWEKWPLFVLAAADAFVTVVAQRSGNTVRTLAQVSFGARVENALVSYCRYLEKAFWPVGLVPMYVHPGNSLAMGQVVGASAVLVGVTALVCVLAWGRRDRRHLAMGWFWFLGTLVPMIGIVTVGDQAMADRYAYLPFIGLFIAVVWTVGELAAAWRIQGAWVGAAVLLVLGILGSLTYRQIGHWFDEETLWRYTLSVNENNYVAHNNLALALAKTGRSDEAVAHFQQASALHAYPAKQIVRLAIYETRVGHPVEAVEQCRELLRTSSDPRVEVAALSQMGRAFLQMGRYDEAAASYRRALEKQPRNEDALLGAGLLALRLGDFAAAVARFSLAVEADRNEVNLLLLAQGLRGSGQTSEAERTEQEARRISTSFPQAQEAMRQFLALAGIQPL